MSVYLYNLLFSLIGSDATAGRFTPYGTTILNPTISNLSCAWFKYLPSGTPFNLGDYFTTVAGALSPADWGNPQPDTTGLQLIPGDYLMMRVASADANAGSYLARFTGVFGRGTSQLLNPGSGDLQSPLLMNTLTTQSSYPRAVVDVDGSSVGNWPEPIATDKSWVNWLGGVHVAPNNAANDYTVNVGISVYNAPNTYTFGRDPRLHVGGMMKHKRDDCAA